MVIRDFSTSHVFNLVKLFPRPKTRPISPKWWWKVREIPGYFREIKVGEILFHLARYTSFAVCSVFGAGLGFSTTHDSLSIKQLTFEWIFLLLDLKGVSSSTICRFKFLLDLMVFPSKTLIYKWLYKTTYLKVVAIVYVRLETEERFFVMFDVFFLRWQNFQNNQPTITTRWAPTSYKLCYNSTYNGYFTPSYPFITSFIGAL